ncbi:MAG: hypothetical protein U5K56_16800 [Halioglobus sp.]|nr:hypothetical protein [Halioglobus sp.]
MYKNNLLGPGLVLAALLAGCAEPPPPTERPPFRAVATVKQTMTWILDPAADVIWDSAGTIITAEGSEELAPTTDEGWDAVLHAAAIVTEGGNLLMMPGRSAGDDWLEYSAGLVAAGRLAIDAAEARDPDALFEAGGRIYQVCRACHNQYWVVDETPE